MLQKNGRRGKQVNDAHSIIKPIFSHRNKEVQEVSGGRRNKKEDRKKKRDEFPSSYWKLCVGGGRS
jgi:hypothetical protein